MASIKLTGDTSGEITISAPAVAGTNTLTLPANTGTIVTSASGVGDLPSTIAGPAFSARIGTNQSITSGVQTKMALTVEEFDTNSLFDSVTNYRFTPNIEGYYQVNGQCTFTGTVTIPQVSLYKNGSIAKRGTIPPTGQFVNMACLIYMNGTTDYIELYAAHVTGSTQTLNAQTETNFFNAHLARAV